MAPTLRPRNAKIAPVYALNKKDKKLSVVKKVIDKKQKVRTKTPNKRVRIFDDTILDMFRFFTRRELSSFKLVTRRMNRAVELGDQKKQLRQRFVLNEIHFSVSSFNHFFYVLFFIWVILDLLQGKAKCRCH
jgi:hypothetical protein